MDSGLDKLKALVTTKRIPADVIHEVLYNLDTRAKWDHGGKDMHVVEKINDELDVIYFWAKAPPTVTNREFLQSRLTRTLDDGTLVIIYRSIKHDKHPEQPKKFVRAYTKLSGYVIRPNPSGQGARVTFLSQNDIKASVPTVRRPPPPSFCSSPLYLSFVSCSQQRWELWRIVNIRSGIVG